MIQQSSLLLGALESSHHVRRRGSSLFIAVFITATAALVAGMVYVDLIVCSAVPILILIWVVLEFIAKRRTELLIYENGLIYRALFKTRQIMWEEVAEFGHTLDDGSGNIQRQRNQAVWIVTDGGRKLSLRVDLADIHGIVRAMAVKIFGREHVDYYAEDYAGGTLKTTRSVTEIEGPENEEL